MKISAKKSVQSWVWERHNPVRQRAYIFPIPKKFPNEINGFMRQNIALYDFDGLTDAC
jgi:hypothetical protein